VCNTAGESNVMGSISGSGGSGGSVFDPVPSVMAQTPTPPMITTITSQCDKTYTLSNIYVYNFAEASFPGKTKEEIGRKLSVLVLYHDAQIPGYSYLQSLASVKDGFAAINCGISGIIKPDGTVQESTPTINSVIFQLTE
jgi:hypothetical protein